MIINLIANIFKNKTRKIVVIILISFITLLFASQYVHFHFYDCFYSIYSLIHGGQVFGFIYAIIKIIFENILGLLVILFTFIIFVILIVYSKNTSKRKIFSMFLVLFFNIVITTIISFIPTSDPYYRKNLIFDTNTETNNVNSFGLLTSMIIDTIKYNTSSSYHFTKTNSYMFKKTDLKTHSVLENSFNIETDNEEILRLNKYLKGTYPTNKNEYTGIFKDKNLIFITAESFSFQMIDKDITPTLYKLSSEGFKFNNFYTPIYYASTSDGEYTNLTSLLPQEGTWSYIYSKDNVMPFSYANILNKQGYKSFAYHNGEYDFYDRDKILPNYGYKYKACGSGLEKDIKCNIFPQSDKEMLSTTVNEYKNKKFNVYYMTISNHLPHDFKKNDLTKNYQNEVKDLKYNDSIKAYYAALIDLDKGLESIIDTLKKENKLDNTVIVLAPDHFPYGLSKKEYNDVYKYEENYQKHKSGLIIYNSKTKAKEINKYASNIDILPTLLNMFGVEYDSRYLIGNDIMSSSEGIVIFNDHSFLTDKGYYNEVTNTFSNKEIDENYIKNKKEEVFNKYNASSLISKTNYYKYIK